jgi:hypothetical protein
LEGNIGLIVAFLIDGMSCNDLPRQKMSILFSTHLNSGCLGAGALVIRYGGSCLSDGHTIGFFYENEKFFHLSEVCVMA